MNGDASWERGHLARGVPLGGLEARAPRHGDHGDDADKATSEAGQSRCRIIRGLRLATAQIGQVAQDTRGRHGTTRPVDKAGAKSCLDVSIGVVRNGGGFEVNANVVCGDAVYPVAGYRRTCSTPIFHSTAQSKTTISATLDAIGPLHATDLTQFVQSQAKAAARHLL